MKIRTDFVTNSSSVSFIYIQIAGTKLTQILNRYKSIFEGEYKGTIRRQKDAFVLDSDCFGIDYYIPKAQTDVADAFIYLLQGMASDVDGDEHDLYVKLVSELKKNKKEVNDTIYSMEWELSEMGSGGDSDARFYLPYSDKFIREYMGLEEGSEITDELHDKFMEKIIQATSVKHYGSEINENGFKYYSYWELL